MQSSNKTRRMAKVRSIQSISLRMAKAKAKVKVGKVKVTHRTVTVKVVEAWIASIATMGGAKLMKKPKLKLKMRATINTNRPWGDQ